MAAKLEEITARYLRERMRFENNAGDGGGDTVIAEVWVNSTTNAAVTIKGQADIDELREDQTYRFYGRWSNYKNKRTGLTEKQFHFSSFVADKPHGREGIVAYLTAAGEGLGFGKQRAAKCWEVFGVDAVQACRESPEAVAEALRNHGLRTAETVLAKVAENLQAKATLENCTLDLMDLLNGRGFPKGTPRAAIRQWGNQAANRIRRNPYVLMALHGCGFKRCDALYLDLKLPAAAIRRQGYSAWYAIARDTEGHTWFPLATAEMGIRGNIGGAAVQLEKAMIFARRLGAIHELRTGGSHGPIIPRTTATADGAFRWIAEGSKAANESDLARAIADANREPVTWPSVEAIDGNVTDHQRTELAKSLANVVGILGGSPGTGKTYTLAALAKLLVKIVGADNILIGAPTGKAATRVSENLAAYGLPLKARTWHSHLNRLKTLGQRYFFSAKVLIGDESSMVDTDLMAAVLRARPVGCHVLLVGDVNQLPPVGHGAPLRDLIAAGLPYGELREVKRNSGGIVETCAAIRDGKRWQDGDNLTLFEHNEAEFQIKRMVQVIHHLKDTQSTDPVWSIQVVTAVNKKSALSRRELNRILQAELNHQEGVPGCPFRVGDKIVNTKNGYFPSHQENDFDADGEEAEKDDSGKVYVANGELAEVLEVREGMLIARLWNPSRTIKIPRGKATDDAGGTGDDADPKSGDEANDEATNTGCSWDLGYALSVHKSQGSEWPVVIVMLDEYLGAMRVCSREWLYTAVSRAKDRCVLIGKRSTADQMCRRVAIGKRKTLLKERILLAKAENELAEL